MLGTPPKAVKLFTEFEAEKAQKAARRPEYVLHRPFKVERSLAALLKSPLGFERLTCGASLEETPESFQVEATKSHIVEILLAYICLQDFQVGF